MVQPEGTGAGSNRVTRKPCCTFTIETHTRVCERTHVRSRHLRAHRGRPVQGSVKAALFSRGPVLPSKSARKPENDGDPVSSEDGGRGKMCRVREAGKGVQLTTTAGAEGQGGQALSPWRVWRTQKDWPDRPPDRPSWPRSPRPQVLTWSGRQPLRQDGAPGGLRGALSLSQGCLHGGLELTPPQSAGWIPGWS